MENAFEWNRNNKPTRTYGTKSTTERTNILIAMVKTCVFDFNEFETNSSGGGSLFSKQDKSIKMISLFTNKICNHIKLINSASRFVAA